MSTSTGTDGTFGAKGARPFPIVPVLLALVVILFLTSLAIGPVRLSLGQVARALPRRAMRTG